ncbi:MAG: hypothetical protein QXH71_01320 [Candidatus Anstonellaceae archaeon]
MGKIVGQIFSLEILFVTIILFLLLIGLESLENKRLYLDDTQKLIEDYSDTLVYSLIKSGKIKEAVYSQNYDYIKTQLGQTSGVCQQLEIYNQTLEPLNLIYSYNNNCTINKQKNNYIQKIFFDGGKDNRFYIIKIKVYRE